MWIISPIKPTMLPALLRHLRTRSIPGFSMISLWYDFNCWHYPNRQFLLYIHCFVDGQWQMVNAIFYDSESSQERVHDIKTIYHSSWRGCFISDTQFARREVNVMHLFLLMIVAHDNMLLISYKRALCSLFSISIYAMDSLMFFF
jgi:hypothetical protein